MTKVQHWVAIGSVFVASAILGRPAEANIEELAIINGTGGQDTLVGTSGPDEMYGGAYSDMLEGMGGADKIDCGADTDIVNYVHSPAAVQVILALLPGYPQTGGDAQGDTLFNCEWVVGSRFDDLLAGDGGYNVIWGSDGNDVMNGFAGDDTLWAENGNDTLLGGAGKDALYGGDGDDIFRFGGDIDSLSSAPDTIGDWGNGNDKIHLQFMTVSVVTKYASIAALDGATLAANQVGYANDGKNTFVRSGAAASFRLMIERFTGTLSTANFLP